MSVSAFMTRGTVHMGVWVFEGGACSALNRNLFIWAGNSHDQRLYGTNQNVVVTVTVISCHFHFGECVI